MNYFFHLPIIAVFSISFSVAVFCMSNSRQPLSTNSNTNKISINQKQNIQLANLRNPLVTHSVNAATPKVKLSIQEAISRGIKQSFDLQIMKMEKSVREEEYTVGKILLFTPKFNISSNSSYTNTMLNSKYNDGYTSDLQRPTDEQKHKDEYFHAVTLNMTSINLFNSWKDKDNLDKKKLANLLSDLASNQTILTFMINIATSYYNLFFLQEKILYLQEKTKMINTIITTQDKNSELDTLVLEQEKLSSETEIENQKLNYLQAQISFNQLLNEDHLTDFQLTSDLDMQNLAIDFDKLLSNLDTFPAYQGARYLEENSRIDFLRSKLNYLPQLSINLGSETSWGFLHQNHDTNEVRKFNPNTGEEGNINLAVNLTWNLDLWGTDGFLGHLAYDRANIEVRKAAFNTEKTKRDIYFQLYQLNKKIMLQNSLIAKNKNLTERSLKILLLQSQLLLKDSNVALTLKNYLDEYSQSYSDLIQAKLDLLASRAQLASMTGKINYLSIQNISANFDPQKITTQSF